MTARMTASGTTAIGDAGRGRRRATSLWIAASLGLGQLDVGHRQPARGVAGRRNWARRPGGGGRAGSGRGSSRVRTPARGWGGTVGWDRALGRDDSSAPGRRPAAAAGPRTSQDRYAAGHVERARGTPHPDRRAAQHRLGADRRGDARHECRRAGSRADRGRRRRRPDHGPARPAGGRQRRRSPRPRACRLVVSTGGLGPTPGRPDPRGDRRGCGETPVVDPDLEALAARPVGPPRHPVPRAQPQAGMADPVRRGAAQPERHGARLVRRRRPDGRVASPCPVRRARCGRCGPTRRCRAFAARGLGADVAGGRTG